MVASRSIRRCLYARFAKTYNVTYKKSRGSILGRVLTQKFGICWAIALIRHFTALLKLAGRLPAHEELSIEDLVQLFHQWYPSFCNREGDYGITMSDFDKAAKILKRYGVVLDSVNPLRNRFESVKQYSRSKPPPERFKVKAFYHVKKCIHGNFEKLVWKELKKSPVACVVSCFESFDSVKGKELYDPDFALEEIQESHLMLLVARGKVWSPSLGIFKHFFEFQDSNGEGTANKGYVRVRCGRDLIRSFFVMKL